MIKLILILLVIKINVQISNLDEETLNRLKNRLDKAGSYVFSNYLTYYNDLSYEDKYAVYRVYIKNYYNLTALIISNLIKEISELKNEILEFHITEIELKKKKNFFKNQGVNVNNYDKFFNFIIKKSNKVNKKLTKYFNNLTDSKGKEYSEKIRNGLVYYTQYYNASYIYTYLKEEIEKYVKNVKSFHENLNNLN